MGLGYILLELGRPGDTSLRGAGGGRCTPRMPEISSGPSFSLCSLSDPVGVLVACLPSWMPLEDLGLSSSGSPVPASFLPNRRLSKQTGRAFSAGLPTSSRLLGSILVSGAFSFGLPSRDTWPQASWSLSSLVTTFSASNLAASKRKRQSAIFRLTPGSQSIRGWMSSSLFTFLNYLSRSSRNSSQSWRDQSPMVRALVAWDARLMAFCVIF